MRFLICEVLRKCVNVSLRILTNISFLLSDVDDLEFILKMAKNFF